MKCCKERLERFTVDEETLNRTEVLTRMKVEDLRNGMKPLRFPATPYALTLENLP